MQLCFGYVEIDSHARGKSRYLVFRYQLKSYPGLIIFSLPALFFFFF